jgi:hypothetical protein
VVLFGKEHGAVVEQVRVRIVTVDEENFGNVSAARPTLDMDDNVKRVGDIGLDGSKAKVRPATTMATSERPRAMVLVKAVIRTLTAFSQGEPPCANAGAARSSVKPSVTRGERSQVLRR